MNLAGQTTDQLKMYQKVLQNQANKYYTGWLDMLKQKEKIEKEIERREQ